MAAAAQANPQAFTPLYERYLDRIYRFCYNRLEDRQAAEDAASEVFLQALAHLRTYRSVNFWGVALTPSPATSSLRTIGGRGAANRSPTPRQRRSRMDPLAGQAERTALLLALEQSSDDQRAAVELPAAGWSDAQIGAMLDKSEVAVRIYTLSPCSGSNRCGG